MFVNEIIREFSTGKRNTFNIKLVYNYFFVIIDPLSGIVHILLFPWHWSSGILSSTNIFCIQFFFRCYNSSLLLKLWICILLVRLCVVKWFVCVERAGKKLCLAGIFYFVMFFILLISLTGNILFKY